MASYGKQGSYYLFSYLITFFRFGRDNFQGAMKLANRSNLEDIDWTKFSFMVFDTPNKDLTYCERYAILGNYFIPYLYQSKTQLFCLEKYFKRKKGDTYVKLAPWKECKGTDHLEKFLQDVIDKGGEGIILRDPASVYQAGRSPGFLKHKVLFLPYFTMQLNIISFSKKFRDGEAKIVGRQGLQWECEL